MSDVINNLDQLVQLASLREVVVHELIARRELSPDTSVDLSPEELHAPNSADDDAAISVSPRLEPDELGVRCRFESVNAFGDFTIDAEVIYNLPSPIAAHRTGIVRDFAERAAMPALFPYIRAALNSLASQMGIPVSALPFALPVDFSLSTDEDPPAEQFTPPPIHARFTTSSEDGTELQGEFIIDPATGSLTRFGAEGQTPGLDEILDGIANLPSPQEMSLPEWIVRNVGEEMARFVAEKFREWDSDAAADQAHAEIDEIVDRLATEKSLTAFEDALDLLTAAAESDGPPDKVGAVATAAERVRESWTQLRTRLISES
jgi:hypothetical protein